LTGALADLKSVKLAYLRETGAVKEAFYEEEELPQEAMKTLRVYETAKFPPPLFLYYPLVQ
jgi:hypothetical protein